MRNRIIGRMAGAINRPAQRMSNMRPMRSMSARRGTMTNVDRKIRRNKMYMGGAVGGAMLYGNSRRGSNNNRGNRLR